ncbi:hypothetical protein BEL04_08520 [Mucilaginibacter sp. PPCGB 2223]|uniref:hypothetical protein n=1 Tax=Mucilaginibacter sp. PPCGB 2223 TaxID=1886027 RepID=UPI00082719B9|nr:hypothetical protein [Mucilaginibacter sp. PPCGB 2223]OCX54292.1 hypothetical protein BEL04_08520 [Mucilaginibacter sp. PPCGB 2223]
MKTIKIYLILLLGTSIALLWTCKKSDEQKEQDKAIFDGSARVRGTVFFRNSFKGTIDTAKNVSLTIYKGDDSTQYYAITLTSGSFDLSGLSGGKYSFKATYIGGIPGSSAKITYQKIITLNIAKDSFLDNQVLLIDQSTLATPTLVLTVKDAGGAAVANAQVCLYTDPLSLTKNQNTCMASYKSGVSNSAGIVTFADLGNVKYYATAYTAVGGDTTSNRATATANTYGPYAANGLEAKDITINPEKPTLKIVVTDVNGAYMGNAQVCVFSDLGLITKYKYKCTGSLKSATADQNGLAVFKSMQPITYYISASKVIGKDTLSNVLTQSTPTATLSPTSTNQFTIVIK